MTPRYRVLSLDLHDTIAWDTEAIVDAQYAVRLNRLAERLRMSSGDPVLLEELRRARAALHEEWKRDGMSPETIPLVIQVDLIRQRLGAQYAGDPESAVLGYAEGGLKEHPAQINPEAQALIRSLNDRRFPVIVTTNTSRSGSAWKLSLEEAGGFRVTDVIASTDVGACKPDPRVFSEVVRSTGVPAAAILHVGDSWVMDVEGARRFGMGAALYRGLSQHYWEANEAREGPKLKDSSVPCLDHLSEVVGLLGLT